MPRPERRERPLPRATADDSLQDSVFHGVLPGMGDRQGSRGPSCSVPDRRDGGKGLARNRSGHRRSRGGLPVLTTAPRVERAGVAPGVRIRPGTTPLWRVRERRENHVATTRSSFLSRFAVDVQCEQAAAGDARQWLQEGLRCRDYAAETGAMLNRRSPAQPGGRCIRVTKRNGCDCEVSLCGGESGPHNDSICDPIEPHALIGGTVGQQPISSRRGVAFGPRNAARGRVVNTGVQAMPRRGRRPLRS